MFQVFVTGPRRARAIVGGAICGAVLALVPAVAPAAVVAFTGTRENVNLMNPPGSGRCSPPYLNTVNIAPGALSSTGTTTAFGDFTATKSHCIVSTPPTPLLDGLFRYDFATGDAFFGTYTGEVTASGAPGIFDTIETLIVTGGTGRFLNASGMFTDRGSLRFGPNPAGPGSVGIYSGRLAGELNLPAIPEPSTWVILILGFGLAGAALRRRGKSDAGGNFCQRPS